MLRPEQMSKVSVTGSKQVMDDVIEAVHDLRLLHVTDYDDSWEGFRPGNPIEGAEEASDKLVTVRAIESILDVDEDDAGPTRIVTDEALESELADLRETVNELDDERDELEDELRDVRERIESMEPFATLGIDLDLLSGYDTLDVAVGEGDPDAIESALVDADGIATFDVFSEDGVVAIFARPAANADDGVLTDALVGVDFASFDVPDAEGSPEEYVRELEHRAQQLESKLDTVEDELEDVKLDAAGFLLAAEEKLSIDVQRTEAPLSFATTENAFVAEGWIPSERYTEFARAVQDEVGDHAEVEELERASFGSDGTEKLREQAPGNGGDDAAAATDGGRARADGGANVVMRDDSPPVVQDNPGIMKPFELLVQAVSRPTYKEFDPTVILFLTFPAFFGFMIGDFGYGALYTLIGYYLYSNYDSPGFKSMGGITVFAGLFTMLFGFLYGEIFGLHLITDVVWGGHPPMEKGLSPAGKGFALTWLVISILVGIVHLNVGYVIDFVENVEFHDVKHAVLESGSWILMLNGLWVWILSRHAAGSKPNFMFTVFDGSGAAPEAAGEFVHATYAVGFNGFPVVVGLAGLAAFFVGFVLLVAGEPIEAVEFLNVLVNALSYTRIAAVLLAKAGMAFVVNLLFFGAYVHDGEFHFLISHGPQYVAEHGYEMMFPGLMHSGAAGLVGGLLVLVLGHALVLALGVTSAGLQAVRLEYVEFFGKFYEGGGKAYEPFGYERRFTTED
ncbi:MAG: V-type ATP synthase subunit I [Haloferacaceae archaeon]